MNSKPNCAATASSWRRHSSPPPRYGPAGTGLPEGAVSAGMSSVPPLQDACPAAGEEMGEGSTATAEP